MTSAPSIISVAISYVAGSELPDSVRALLKAPAAKVAAGLAALGVASVYVNAAEPEADAAAVLSNVDGVVIMGGIDVDPAAYGQEITADNIHFTNRSADEYEARLIRAAHGADVPVFGICRGSQIINVAFGGTLLQDLGVGAHIGQILGEGAGRSPDDRWKNHDVHIEPGTKLADILGETTLDVRVSHHQAVDRVGDGLVVAARADDGIIEGVEATEGWVLGVQWHPEQVKAEPEALTRLLTGFVQAIEVRQAQAA